MQVPEEESTNESLAKLTAKAYYDLGIAKSEMEEKETQIKNLASQSNEIFNQEKKTSKDVKDKIIFLQELASSLSKKNEELERKNRELEEQKSHNSKLTQDLRRNLEKVVDEFSKRGLSVRDYLLFNFCDFRTTTICEAGRKMFYINTAGDIYNCQMQEYGEPLTNIIKGNLLETLRKNHIKRPYAALCGDCPITDYCHGDCPVNNGPARREYFCDIMKGFFSHAARNVLEFARKEPTNFSA